MFVLVRHSAIIFSHEENDVQLAMVRRWLR